MSTERKAKSTFAVETGSPAATEALAAELARALVPPASGRQGGRLEAGGTLILLTGELGTGKTVFVRGLLRGLDAPPEVAVTSPTYVLQHTYRGGRRTLHHLDIYRLAGGALEFENSGLLECLDDPGALVAVEWPERLGAFAWPADRVEVTLDHAGPKCRRVVIRATGATARAACSRLEPQNAKRRRRKGQPRGLLLLPFAFCLLP
jgi:tRNA threonylcarbamoyladenosine biosynthesis protein TsaE